MLPLTDDLLQPGTLDKAHRREFVVAHVPPRNAIR